MDILLNQYCGQKLYWRYKLQIKHPWNTLKLPWSTQERFPVETPLKLYLEPLQNLIRTPLNFPKTVLKLAWQFFWTSFSTCLKNSWTNLTTSIRHPWNIHRTPMKHTWKIFQSTLKHTYINTLEISLKISWHSHKVLWKELKNPFNLLKISLKHSEIPLENSLKHPGNYLATPFAPRELS